MATVEVRSAVGRFADVATALGAKPGVGACWCMSYRDARLSNDERPVRMRELCEQEPGPGVLAYVDGAVAGWCSIAPRGSYRRLLNSRTIPILDERDAWVAVCFVVRAGYRRRGLMHALLDGAVAHADGHGAEVVEGYPVELGPEDRVHQVGGYVGTSALFAAHGFTRVAGTEAVSDRRPRCVMRRELRAQR